MIHEHPHGSSFLIFVSYSLHPYDFEKPHMDLFKWANKKIVEKGARHDADGPLYKPLDGKQVRLLYLPQGEISDALQFNMFRASLGDNKYGALSYVWGNPAETEPLVVNGHTVQVTKNLADALRHIRFYLKYTLKVEEAGGFGVAFWCDAICIDQQNIDEKNQQVPMMHEIYSSCVGMAWARPGHSCCDAGYRRTQLRSQTALQRRR